MKNLNSLPNNTKEVLLSLSETEIVTDFTFVGGSALSIYLNHRKSEDIDLFTWKETIDAEQILSSIKQHIGNNFTIESISNKQLDLRVKNVKLTFFANKWSELKNADPFVNNIKIATLDLLTAMKINTIFLRAKFRDYYDLYVINKEVYSIEQMYAIIKKQMPQINQKLFQMALIFTDDILEESIIHLEPKYNVSINHIGKHFEKSVKEYLKI